MIHPDEALKIILGALRPLCAARTRLEDADGLALAEELRASCDLPAFDNSAMDGYAVRAAELAQAAADAPAELGSARTVRAGEAGPGSLRPGEACRIMTGAMIPDGADAVVMRERAETAGGKVKFFEPPRLGQYIRRRGEDVRAGGLLLSPGAKIGPYEIGLLAAQGIGEFSAVPRPRVAVLGSGDELVDFRSSPGPGKIRDASGPALAAALRRWGFAVSRRAAAGDTAAEIRSGLAAALDSCDALLVTGGVSVGDFDHTREALSGLGFRELFWRVRIRPGKPLLFGLIGEKPVFGLPGNPISTMVCAEVFARPALERLAGRLSDRPAFPCRGVLAKAFEKPESLRHYLFCSARAEGGRTALSVLEPQGSALLAMASRADALAVGPIGSGRLPSGMELEFRWLR